MDQKKDVRKLLRQLKKAGCEIDDSGPHYKVRDASGTVLFGISRTPSDHLAIKRIRSDCRKAGLLERS